MKRLLYLTLLLSLVVVACKKDKKTTTTTTEPAPGTTTPAATEYKRVKYVRTIDTVQGKLHTNLSYYTYNSVGQPVNIAQTDSMPLTGGGFTVTTSQTNYYYNVAGKMSKMESISNGNNSTENYSYDASNKLKFSVSFSNGSNQDTTFFTYSGTSGVGLLTDTANYQKIYFTSNIDSLIFGTSPTKITGRISFKYNSTVDLTMAYFNKYLPMPGFRNQIIETKAFFAGITNTQSMSYSTTSDSQGYPRRIIVTGTSTQGVQRSVTDYAFY